jgi:uncharacterized lipoprotein YajG
MKQTYTFVLLPIVAVFLACAGCVVHRTAHVNYQPKTLPVLARLKPVAVRLQVTDSRPAEERDRVARAGKVIFVLEKNAPDLMFDSIKTGLEQQGHRVTEDPQAPVDVLLTVDLKRIFVDYETTSIASGTKTATVRVAATVQRINASAPARNFTVESAHRLIIVLVGSTSPHEKLTLALNDAVNQLLTDERLVETFKQSAP